MVIFNSPDKELHVMKEVQNSYDPIWSKTKIKNKNKTSEELLLLHSVIIAVSCDPQVQLDVVLWGKL